MSTLTSALALDILCALAAHHWFNQHEPSVSWSLLPVLAIPLPAAWILIKNEFSYMAALLAAYLVFFATLFSSIVLYRLSPFHPLAKYPGPISGKISQLWAVVVVFRGNAHHYRKKLHDRYGSIVRIGPNELSIADKDMLPYILGSQGMPKGPLFEGRQMTPVSVQEMEHLNLISTRDLQRHAVLRRAWNKAFANSALRDYEELMLLRAHQLINSLKNICKEERDGVAYVDIATWIGYFTFDFMGDMVFGGGFELMRDGDNRLLVNLSRSLYYASLSQGIPWFSCVMRNLPYLGKPMSSLGSFAVERAKIRYRQEQERRDLFYHLVAAYQDDSQESPLKLIVSNSLLAIIAGSDTTASVLRNTIFYLLTNPTYYTRLREEIDAKFPPTETSQLDTEILPDLRLLNAVMCFFILFYQPPVPTTLQRAPARGTKGRLVGTHYFKEGTHIQVPPYVLHRDPKHFFPRPDDFWPDRWILESLGSQEIILDRSCFIPFSMGPANCVGKPLAIIEMRAVLALFIMHFDMEFDDNFDPKTWTESLKDYFILETGKLMVKLRVRRRKGAE